MSVDHAIIHEPKRHRLLRLMLNLFVPERARVAVIDALETFRSNKEKL